MNLGILITIAAGGSALIAYALLERRINQRACRYCHFRVSVVTLDEQCPRCGSGVQASRRMHGSRRADSARLAKSVLIGLPLLVVTIDTAVLIYRGGRTGTDKAVSLVQTSSSRIENFTVQQYLYATVFESRKRGADIIIEGWRAWQSPDDEHSATVEFDFRRDGLLHAAVWEVNVSTETVTARTEEARNLS